MKECLALIQSHNSSSVEDSLKQAGDTEENAKLATHIFGKGLHVHQKPCGRAGGADCIATFVCQSCKQLKRLVLPRQLTMSVTEQDCGECYWFSQTPGEHFLSCNKTSHISFGTSDVPLSKLLVNKAVCSGISLSFYSTVFIWWL